MRSPEHMDCVCPVRAVVHPRQPAFCRLPQKKLGFCLFQRKKNISGLVGIMQCVVYYKKVFKVQQDGLASKGACCQA